MFFLKLSCFFHDLADVGNLISGSSAFSKNSLNIRKFTVHILLKPGLENFEHYFTSMWKWSHSVVSDSMRPCRWQPIRLHSPWDSPGKNTGVGCHFLLHCMKVKIESEITQSCPAVSDPMDCILPASSIHGICKARVLEWGAIAFSPDIVYV